MRPLLASWRRPTDLHTEPCRTRQTWDRDCPGDGWPGQGPVGLMFRYYCALFWNRKISPVGEPELVPKAIVEKPGRSVVHTEMGTALATAAVCRDLLPRQTTWAMYSLYEVQRHPEAFKLFLLPVNRFLPFRSMCLRTNVSLTLLLFSAAVSGRGSWKAAMPRLFDQSRVRFGDLAPKRHIQKPTRNALGRERETQR